MALADAEAAATLGADFLGFIFVKGRRRMHDREHYPGYHSRARLRMPPTVGLFLDEDPATVRHVVTESGLQYAQLCGSESPDYCSELSIPYWKVSTCIRRRTMTACLPILRPQHLSWKGATNGRAAQVRPGTGSLQAARRANRLLLSRRPFTGQR